MEHRLDPHWTCQRLNLDLILVKVTFFFFGVETPLLLQLRTQGSDQQYLGLALHKLWKNKAC